MENIIAIVSAFDSEVAVLRKRIPCTEQESWFGRKLYVGRWMEHSILLATTGMGGINAACSLEHYITQYCPKLVVGVGIAGSPTVPLGMTVIIHTVYGIPSGIAYFAGMAPPECLHCSPLAKQVYTDLCMGKHADRFTIGTARSSDRVCRSLTNLEPVHTVYDMESLAYAHVATMHALPFIAIRTVSDTIALNTAEPTEPAEPAEPTEPALNMRQILKIAGTQTLHAITALLYC